MDTSPYSNRDAKILRENPDATIPELREKGLSARGAERREAELLAQANAPKPKGTENVEVAAEPQPVITDSTVTAPAPTAPDTKLRPQLSPAMAARTAPVQDGSSVFAQVEVQGPNGVVKVSPKSAEYLLSQPGYSRV